MLEIFGCFLRLGSPKTDSTVCVPFATFERTSGECWRPYNSRRSRAAKNLKQIRSNGIHHYNRFTTGSRCYTGTGISVLNVDGICLGLINIREQKKSSKSVFERCGVR